METPEIDPIRTGIEAEYAKGNALIQYSLPKNMIMARFRDKLYEVKNFQMLLDNNLVSDFDLLGIRLAPIAEILALPDTKEC